MFLLVPAHPGSPGQRAVKTIVLLLLLLTKLTYNLAATKKTQVRGGTKVHKLNAKCNTKQMPSEKNYCV